VLRHTASLTLILTSSLALGQAAQTPRTPQAPGTFNFQHAPMSNATVFPNNGQLMRDTGCPVNLIAQRQGSTNLLNANTRQSGPAQGLHLYLNREPGAPTIESIEVTVYAISPKARILPTDIDSSDLRTKTFELRRDSNSPTLKEADVWMSKVGALRWVDLISITWTNGNTWHASQTSRCRSIPSNFVLIGQN
jgi:hypothetical protein